MKNLCLKTKKRIALFTVFFLFLSVVICITLFKLQILANDTYQDSVFKQLTVETKVNPLRGCIYDRNGITLASNKTVWILYAIPKNVKNPEA